MAQRCYDMPNGRLLRLPTSTTPIDESAFFMLHIYVAWRVWYIDGYKLAHKMRATQDDIEFMRKILSDG